MGKQVRVMTGVWVKEDNGEWYFRCLPADKVVEISLRENEPLDSSMQLVRLSYQDMAIYLTDEAMADYEFQRRSGVFADGISYLPIRKII